MEVPAHAQSAQFSAVRSRLESRFMDGSSYAPAAVSMVAPADSVADGSTVGYGGGFSTAMGLSALHLSAAHDGIGVGGAVAHDGVGVHDGIGVGGAVAHDGIGVGGAVAHDGIGVGGAVASAGIAAGGHVSGVATTAAMPVYVDRPVTSDHFSAAVRASTPARPRATGDGDGAAPTPEQRLRHSQAAHEQMLRRLMDLPETQALARSHQVSALRAQLEASQRVLEASAAAPGASASLAGRYDEADDGAPRRPPVVLAATGDMDMGVDAEGKDAIIRHLRGENERLEKLVLDAVNSGERVATAALQEQQAEMDSLRAHNARLQDELIRVKAELAQERRNMRFAVSKLQRFRGRTGPR